MSAQKDTDLIIFDLDGTLVDSKRDIARAMNFTLEEIGLDTRNEDEISGFIGYGLKGLIERSLGSDNMHLFDKTLDIYQKKYQKHMLDTSKLFPNVKEVLEHFKNKTKAIVTNKRGDFSREQLENLGIAIYFKEIIGGDDEKCLKPSPCQIEVILKKFDIAPDKAMLVGDMHVDVISGKRANIATCAVTYGIGDREQTLKADPDFVIDNIIQLKDIIK